MDKVDQTNEVLANWSQDCKLAKAESKEESSHMSIDMATPAISKSPGLFASRIEKELHSIQIDGVRSITETQVILLKHKCNAAIKESLALWDGKSEIFKEQINLLTQSQVQATYEERTSLHLKNIELVLQQTNDSIVKVATNTGYTEMIRKIHLDQIEKTLHQTLADLEKEFLRGRQKISND